jgi:hypothetical protein
MENTLTLEKTPSWIDQKETLSDEIDGSVFGQKLSLTAKLFGCRHRNISRPFNQGATAYRSCLDCGARRQFNPVTLQTYGSYYFPPVVLAEEAL